MTEIALYKSVLVCNNRADRVAELLFPLDEAKEAGISVDAVIGYISKNFIAPAVQSAADDVKAIVHFLFNHPVDRVQDPDSEAIEDGFEQGEIRCRDVSCQTDECAQTAETPRLSSHEEATQFLSEIFPSDPVNICTPEQLKNTADVKDKSGRHTHRKRLKRRLKKLSRPLQRELQEFAQEMRCHKVIHDALDPYNLAWLNHLNIHPHMLREGLLFYRHRMNNDSIKYPEKLFHFCLKKVSRACW